MPERHNINTPRPESLLSGSHSPRQVMTSALTAMITTVRIRVARFELISETPSLPRIAVSPAKNAEPNANHCQLIFSGILSLAVRVKRFDRDMLNFGPSASRFVQPSDEKACCCNGNAGECEARRREAIILNDQPRQKIPNYSAKTNGRAENTRQSVEMP